MNKAQRQMVEDITEFVASGATHSTLVGMLFTIERSDSDREKARKYAEYIVGLVNSAEQHKRGNVKKGNNRAS